VQQENESLVLAVLILLEREGVNVDDKDIYEGLTSVQWPGRMEYFELEHSPGIIEDGKAQKLRYLLDGAHNQAGVENLTKTLEHSFSHNRLIGVWGSMIDKDLAGTLEMIVPLLDKLVITQPDGERSATPEEIYSLLDDGGRQKSECIEDVEKALLAARKSAREGDLIVVGGSLYLIGAVRQLLKGDLA
jgi:dihydrofolate synthase/folylpolyglutamate synthase